MNIWVSLPIIVSPEGRGGQDCGVFLRSVIELYAKWIGGDSPAVVTAAPTAEATTSTTSKPIESGQTTTTIATTAKRFARRP